MVQEWPRGATPPLRSGAVAGRSHSRPEARGSSWEELPLVLGQGQWPGGAPLHLRPDACEDSPHIQGAAAAWAQEGLKELSHIEGQEGGSEEIPLIQGKEQWLSFAGAAMKRYPTPKVRETQVRR